MKSATTTIKAVLEELNELKDAAPSDEEVAALLINSSLKRLVSGAEELQNATDNLADVPGIADPTIIEGDVMQQIEEQAAAELGQAQHGWNWVGSRFLWVSTTV